MMHTRSEVGHDKYNDGIISATCSEYSASQNSHIVCRKNNWSTQKYATVCYTENTCTYPLGVACFN